jgi:hypothetical protein
LGSAVKHGPLPQAKGRVEALFTTSRIDRSKGCVCRESLLGCGDSIHGDLSLVLELVVYGLTDAVYRQAMSTSSREWHRVIATNRITPA